jgi:hypothetical protein
LPVRKPAMRPTMIHQIMNICILLVIAEWVPVLWLWK